MTTASLDQQLETYAELRGALGFALGDDLKTLRRFVAFASATDDSGPITTRKVFDWLDCETSLSRTPASVRLSVVRQFLWHVSASVAETAIPDLRLLAGQRRTIPFIFTPEELFGLMSTVSTLETLEPFRQVTIHTLLGLLASTGLRISEATSLDRVDVMPRSNPDILFIRDTKFDKSRIVPVHSSTRCQLVTYAGERELRGYGRQTTAFFVGKSGGRISRPEIYDAFHQCIQKLGIVAHEGSRPPTIHSLRHTFVVNRLLAWHEAGIDVRTRLIHLSTYLGHVDAACTYWYMTATPELLRSATRGFKPIQGGGE